MFFTLKVLFPAILAGFEVDKILQPFLRHHGGALSVTNQNKRQKTVVNISAWNNLCFVGTRPWLGLNATTIKFKV